MIPDLVKAGLFCPRAARLRVLYVCTGNSCRSQMAEGWTRALLGYLVEPCSAGVERGQLDPGAVAAMVEAGVDISHYRPKLLDELDLESFDCIVTLSERAKAGVQAARHSGLRLHQGFAASPKTGTQEPLEYYRRVRDDLRQFVLHACIPLINER